MLHAKASNQLAVLRLYTRYRATTDTACADSIEGEIACTGRDLALLHSIDGPSMDAVRSAPGSPAVILAGAPSVRR